MKQCLCLKQTSRCYYRSISVSLPFPIIHFLPSPPSTPLLRCRSHLHKLSLASTTNERATTGSESAMDKPCVLVIHTIRIHTERKHGLPSDLHTCRTSLMTWTSTTSMLLGGGESNHHHRSHAYCTESDETIAGEMSKSLPMGDQTGDPHHRSSSTASRRMSQGGPGTSHHISVLLLDHRHQSSYIASHRMLQGSPGKSRCMSGMVVDIARSVLHDLADTHLTSIVLFGSESYSDKQATRSPILLKIVHGLRDVVEHDLLH